MLNARNLGKRYGRGPWVIRGVSLSVADGEVVSVAGGNGSGKSTLLRVLVGLSRPSDGSVTGRPSVTAYVPDRFPPHERLTGLAYLTHFGRVRGLSTADAAKRAQHLLERLDLVGGVRTPIRELSKGNAQKVALAQALLVPPQLLVLDEPFSGLDVSAHDLLTEIIGDTARSGCAVIFTDHREGLSRSTAQSAYRIADGALSAASVDSIRGVAEVVLFGGIDRRWRWAGDPAVLRMTERDGTTVLRIAESSLERVLHAALTDGVRLGGVRRIDAEHQVDGRTA